MTSSSGSYPQGYLQPPTNFGLPPIDAVNPVVIPPVQSGIAPFSWPTTTNPLNIAPGSAISTTSPAYVPPTTYPTVSRGALISKNPALWVLNVGGTLTVDASSSSMLGLSPGTYSVLP